MARIDATTKMMPRPVPRPPGTNRRTRSCVRRTISSMLGGGEDAGPPPQGPPPPPHGPPFGFHAIPEVLSVARRGPFLPERRLAASPATHISNAGYISERTSPRNASHAFAEQRYAAGEAPLYGSCQRTA